MANMTVAEYEHLAELADKGEIEYDSVYSLGVYGALYDDGCSWYCGGVVDTLTASGCLAPQGGFTYGAMNAHDFDLESVWATDGNGIGQYLTFTFAGNNPRALQAAGTGRQPLVAVFRRGHRGLRSRCGECPEVDTEV